MNSRITGTIDFHAHLLTDEYRKAIERLGIDPIEEDGFPLPTWTAEDHLAFMDAADIELAVLTAPPPHLHNGDDALARYAARLVNESTAGICAEHPDRFAFAASLPLPCMDGAVKEARYAMDALGAVGVRLATNSNGIYLGDPTLEPLMEELNHRRALAIIHPCRARLRPENVITGTVAAIYEYPADTTRAVLNMMANRVMTRYPDIRFVVPHVGAFLPYMLQRFSGVSGILASLGMMEPVDAQREFERLYFDIAGDPEPVALDMLLMVADAEHIVYGSDFPHSPAQIVAMKKKHLEQNNKFRTLLQRIYHNNGIELLRL